MINRDVNVSDGLGMLHVRVEGIMAGVDAVKVNISVEENIGP